MRDGPVYRVPHMAHDALNVLKMINHVKVVIPIMLRVSSLIRSKYFDSSFPLMYYNIVVFMNDLLTLLT